MVLEILDKGFHRRMTAKVRQSAVDAYASTKINVPVNPLENILIVIKGFYFHTYTPQAAPADSSLTFWVNSMAQPDTPGMHHPAVMWRFFLQREFYDNDDVDVAHAWNDESPNTSGWD
ncbi:unnamed protein product, partial [marine sediment metagenome]